MVKSLNFDNPTLQAFGCSVNQNMLQMNVEILPALIIQMRDGSKIFLDPNNRTFRIGRNDKFVISGNVNNWAVISEIKNQQVSQQFADKLKNAAKSKGLDLKQPMMKSINSTKKSVQE